MKSSRVPLNPHLDSPLFRQVGPPVAIILITIILVLHFIYEVPHIITHCVSQGNHTDTPSTHLRCSHGADPITDPMPTPIQPETAKPTALDTMPTPPTKLERRATPLPPLPQLVTIPPRRRPRPTHRMLVMRQRVAPLSLRPKIDVAHLAPQAIVALTLRCGCPHAFPPHPSRSASPLPPPPRLLHHPLPYPLLPDLPVPPYHPRPGFFLRGLVLRA